jgi:hypothetical protein
VLLFGASAFVQLFLFSEVETEIAKSRRSNIEVVSIFQNKRLVSLSKSRWKEGESKSGFEF